MNHLTNLKSHNTDQRLQKRPANDCVTEWKLNTALIHSKKSTKSSRVITAMFTWVSVISSQFFLLSLCIINWEMMSPSLATPLRFRDRMSVCGSTYANNFVLHATRSAYHLYGKPGNSGENSNGTVHSGGMFSEKR